MISRSASGEGARAVQSVSLEHLSDPGGDAAERRLMARPAIITVDDDPSVAPLTGGGSAADAVRPRPSVTGSMLTGAPFGVGTGQRKRSSRPRAACSIA